MTGAMELAPADLARLATVVTRRTGMAATEARWPFLYRRVPRGAGVTATP